MKIRVGAVSPPVEGDRFETMRKYIEKKKLDLVCFPEEYFGWDYVKGKPTYIKKREVVERVSEIARQNKTYIITGFLELAKKSPKRFWNETLFFSPEGLIGTHIKIALTPNEIKKGYLAGDKVDVFTTKIGKISPLICYEVWFPEIARIAVLNGAEILSFSSGVNIGKRDKQWKVLWWSRAIENNAFVIACVNAKDGVTSIICGPEKILACKYREGMAIAELDLSNLRKIREGKSNVKITEIALLNRRGKFLKRIGNRMLGF